MVPVVGVGCFFFRLESFVIVVEVAPVFGFAVVISCDSVVVSLMSVLFSVKMAVAVAVGNVGVALVSGVFTRNRCFHPDGTSISSRPSTMIASSSTS